MMFKKFVGAVPRCPGLVYDTVLNITDFSDASTSRYDADGKMNFSRTMAWADQLSYAGQTDWRLGTIDELNYIFTTDLGTQAHTATTDTAGDTAEQVANLALVSNLQTFDYYSSSAFPNSSYIWG